MILLKERNRLLQRYRNSRRCPHQVIAKMDALKAVFEKTT
jgi:hypothetical protein